MEFTTTIVVPGCATRRVHFGRRAGFLNARAGQLLAHRNHHNLWIHACSFVSLDSSFTRRLYLLYGAQGRGLPDEQRCSRPAFAIGRETP